MRLGADKETFEMTDTYLKVILCFAPVLSLNNVVLAFVRNDRNPAFVHDRHADRKHRQCGFSIICLCFRCPWGFSARHLQRAGSGHEPGRIVTAFY